MVPTTDPDEAIEKGPISPALSSVHLADTTNNSVSDEEAKKSSTVEPTKNQRGTSNRYQPYSTKQVNWTFSIFWQDLVP